jgi:hypothetical protein
MKSKTMSDTQKSKIENSSMDNPKFSFSGHQTFPLRYAWLPKAVQTLHSCPDLFSREDALVKLGVGKNMVSSIRYWSETLKLIERGAADKTMKPTLLGTAIFDKNEGWDPFLEDTGTLWLLHWLLVSRRDRASTWYLAFTRFNKDLFTSQNLIEWIEALTQDIPGVRATSSSLKRDIDVFLRTYTPSQSKRDMLSEDSFDCPLVELGLIRSVDHSIYQFVRGPKPSLPDAIFLYALIDYWQLEAPEVQTLSFEKILHNPGSPGKAFKLSENALAERLEQLPEWSKLRFDYTAGMRIVLRQDARTELDPYIALSGYYSDILQETRT